MLRKCIPLFTAAALTTGYSVADEGGYSRLWGERGERWSADSRLPDFSYAGYRRGERQLRQTVETCLLNRFTRTQKLAIDLAGGRAHPLRLLPVIREHVTGKVEVWSKVGVVESWLGFQPLPRDGILQPYLHARIGRLT